jgi:hypothetical protein
MFRFQVDSCLFLLLTGLRYVIDESATCDVLTNEDEWRACVSELARVLVLVVQAVHDCYTA